MSATIHSLPPRTIGAGCIHVWPTEDGYEIVHESRSGESWGCFERVSDAASAIMAAQRLNRLRFGGKCSISIDRSAAFQGAPEGAF